MSNQNPDMSKFPKEPDIPEIKKIKDPFQFERFCIRIGAIPSNYTQALTIEEQILYLINFLENTVIPAINLNADTVNELISQFKILYDYVHDYFDNLDVSEEITQIINQFIEEGKLVLELQTIYNEQDQSLVIQGLGKKL